MKKFLLFVFFTISITSAFAQVIIAEEDFDGTSTWLNDAAANTFVDPNDPSQGLFIQAGTRLGPDNVLFGRDLSNETGEPDLTPVTITFQDVDISSNTGVVVSFEYDLNGFDGPDEIAYSLTVDGSVVDDGIFSGSDKGTYMFNVDDAANSVSLELVLEQNGSGDDFELDNFQVTAAPTGSTVGFDNTSSTSSEADGTIMIPVTLSNYNMNVTLDVATSSISAEMGDVTLNTTQLMFTGNGTQNVSITINDDADIEDEMLEITLTESTSTGITISPATHTLTITDDDVETCTTPVWSIENVTLNSDNDTWEENSGAYSVNGFTGSNGDPTDVWLVYGPLDMTSTSILNLIFDLDEGFDGGTDSELNFQYTTTYTGNPGDAGNNWVSVGTLLGAGDDDQTGVVIDYGAASGTDTYIAIQYTADGAGGSASQITIDNISLEADNCPTVACNISNVVATSTGCNGDDAEFTVTWAAAGTSGTIEVDIDGNGFQTLTNGGTYTITGPTSVATGVTVTVRDVNENSCSATGAVDIPSCPVPLVINEIMFDPNDGTTIFDSNGDGIADSSEDEFVELFNTSGSDLDISGWTLSDASGLRHTFPMNTIVPAGQAITVFGGGTPTGIPGISQTASEGFLGLNNGGDDVIIEDENGTLITSQTYSGGGDGESIARNPDITGSFVDHTTIVTNPVRGSAGSDNTDGTPLPIELIFFTATPQSNAVVLHWRTETELNNAYMAVERSLDGENFAEIGRVKGAGTTFEPQEYTFLDQTPKAGINYYRLRQVDTDGAVNYHKVVAVSFDTKDVVTSVFPTIANDFVTVQTSKVAEAEGVVTVMSLTGKIVTERAFAKGANQIELNVANLAAGQYFIRLAVDGAVTTTRFVKQ